jgi:hypothetical protein
MYRFAEPKRIRGKPHLTNACQVEWTGGLIAVIEGGDARSCVSSRLPRRRSPSSAASPSATPVRQFQPPLPSEVVS